MSKIYRHTPESKAKIAAARRGKKMSEATKRKISESMKGRTFSPETRQRISETLKMKAETDPEFKERLDRQMRRSAENRKGKPRSKATREKISKTRKRKGISHSPEARAKISASRRGKPHSAETKRKISEGLRRTWEARKKEKEITVERKKWQPAVTVRVGMSVVEMRNKGLTIDEISDVTGLPRVEVFEELQS